MKIPHVQIKSQNEANPQSESMEMFSPIQEFALQIARAVDTAIIEALDKTVGTGWKFENIEIEELPNTDPTKQGTRRLVKYDGKGVAIIRSIVAAQENKVIGNVYLETEERELA